MRAIRYERRDWVIIALILLFGLLCILMAARSALRFTPLWELDANMESLLDPNSDFLTRKPSGFIEPVDPAILTNPAGIYAFLTPGASSSTATQAPATTGSSVATPTTGSLITTQTARSTTIVSVTSTAMVFPSPTKTSVFFPPSPSSTSRPNPVFTYTATSSVASTSTTTSIVVFTSTPSSTSAATTTTTQTPTPTSTATATATSTAMSTSIATPTSGSCTTTITITGTSGSYAIPGGATCFQYTDLTFVNGGIFQVTTTSTSGTVGGSGCPTKSFASGSTEDYGVTQSGGLMTFRVTGPPSTVDINISDWTTYPTCP